MEALQVYASDSDSDGSDADGEHSTDPPPQVSQAGLLRSKEVVLPSADDLLRAFPSAGSEEAFGGRVRSFPHVVGNYALHVYIPVHLSSTVRSKLEPFLDRATALFPALLPMEAEVAGPGNVMNPGSGQRIALSAEYHISIGRTVPIRVHQIDTMVQMLRNKFASQKRYWIEYGVWEAFINDERTRSFLAIEVVAAGATEIHRQVAMVDDVYKLHNLPTFYKNPRPHISVAWVSGDEMTRLSHVATELNKMSGINGQASGRPLWTSQVTSVECKIGQKLYPIWTSSTDNRPHLGPQIQ